MRDGKPPGSRPHGGTRFLQIPGYGVPREGLRGSTGGVGQVVEGLPEGGVESWLGLVRVV